MNDLILNEGDIRFPANAEGISVIDTAYKSIGMYVRIYIGNRHFDGYIKKIDEYHNIIIEDKYLIRHIKAGKITEIDIFKQGEAHE
jgi:hypothetical protein